MIRNSIWFLLVTLLTSTQALHHHFLHNSYHYCCRNQSCRINFDLSDCRSDYEHDRFQYMLDMMLYDMYLDESMFPLNVSCTNSTWSILESIMCGYRFCLPNEIMELNKGCQCRLDKRCDVKTPADLRLSSGFIVLLTLLATCFIIFYGITMLKEQKKIHKLLDGQKIPTLDQVLARDKT